MHITNRHGDWIPERKPRNLTIAQKMGIEDIWPWMWQKYEGGMLPEQIAAEITSRTGVEVPTIHVSKALLNMPDSRKYAPIRPYKPKNT